MWASQNGAGANLPRLSPKTIVQYPLSLPPVSLQKVLVRRLRSAQQIPRVRRYALQVCDQLRSTTFREKLNHADVKPASLGDICLKITDGVHITPTYLRSGVPFLRVTDMQSEEIDWTGVKRISHEEYDEITRNTRPGFGDILYSKNGTIGIAREVTWRNPFAHFVSLALLRPNKHCVSSKFLAAWLNTPEALQQATRHSKTGTVTNLHLNEIEKIIVPLPSLTDQAHLEQLITQGNRIRAIHVESLRQARHLFQTLLHESFAN
jgi:type I restriction enzyme S subunit